MDHSSPLAASSSTQAITIPSHNSSTMSSHYLSRQNVKKRVDHDRRPLGPSRIDSDIGNTSASSVGSDWSISPTSLAQNTEQSRLRIQGTVASPYNANQMSFEPSTPDSQRQRKDKHRASASDLPPNTLPPLFTSPSPLGPSMLSSSAYKSVNLTSHYDPDSKEPARLITYTKHSQGFTWNDELFLPSYLLNRHRHRGHGGHSSRRRWGDDDDDGIGEFEEEGERCPVTDIFVTDEEAAAMMP